MDPVPDHYYYYYHHHNNYHHHHHPRDYSSLFYVSCKRILFHLYLYLQIFECILVKQCGSKDVFFCANFECPIFYAGLDISLFFIDKVGIDSLLNISTGSHVRIDSTSTHSFVEKNHLRSSLRLTFYYFKIAISNSSSTAPVHRDQKISRSVNAHVIAFMCLEIYFKVPILHISENLVVLLLFSKA